MICGFVLAKKGEKISKSKNNRELSPQLLIENHSADVIRYWSAGLKLGTDTFFSIDELSIAKRFITKLWNASKFCIFHLSDNKMGTITNSKTHADLIPVDRWITEKCRQTAMNTSILLNKYETGLARHEIDDFFWKDFCDNYIEIVKERLYKPEIHGYEGQQSARHALYYCMVNILKMYAIYVPHITEYIYQEYFRQYEGSVSLHKLYWEKEPAADHEIIKFGEKLKSVIADTRKYKSANNMSMKSEIEEVVIKADENDKYLFRQTIGDIKACCRAINVRIKCNS
jgi:valyl-tRNA synthetase